MHVDVVETTLSRKLAKQPVCNAENKLSFMRSSLHDEPQGRLLSVWIPQWASFQRLDPRPDLMVVAESVVGPSWRLLKWRYLTVSNSASPHQKTFNAPRMCVCEREREKEKGRVLLWSCTLWVWAVTMRQLSTFCFVPSALV